MSWAVLIKVACRITAYYKETIIEQFLQHNVNTMINSCLENSWKKTPGALPSRNLTKQIQKQGIVPS